MKCQKCGMENPVENSYCGHCGFVLNPEMAELRQTIEKVVEEKIKDKDMVKTEIAVGAAEKFQNWVKIFAYFVGIPFTIIALGITIFGLRSVSNLPEMNHAIETQQAAFVTQQAEFITYQENFNAFQVRSTVIANEMEAQLANASVMLSDHAAYIETQVAESAMKLEKDIQESHTKIEQSSALIEDQVNTLVTRVERIEETIPLPGRDIENGCIHSANWDTYPIVVSHNEQEGCLALDDWGFFAMQSNESEGIQGGLLISTTVESPVDVKVERGVFSSISNANLNIDLRVRVDSINTQSDSDNLISIGIIPDSPVDLKSGYFYYFLIRGSSGSPVIAIKEPRRAYQVVQLPGYSFNKTYALTFRLRDNTLEIWIDNILYGSYRLSSTTYAKRAFWIGYALYPVANLDAFISDLSIQED